MKKRIISFITAFSMAAMAHIPLPVLAVDTAEPAAPEVALAEAYGELEYAVNDNGTVTITGCDQSVTSVDIPAEIDGMAVTAIDNGAFWRCYSLTSVRIPDSVTTIGDHAFYSCGSLTGISIPGSVTTIGDYAFERCESLTNISIPNSVTTIGDSTFCDCYNLTGISIPDSVTTIGNSAFNGCSNLTGISIPDSVTSIGDNAFADCESLTGISIPDSVTTIGYGAFNGCSNLTGINIPDSVTSIDGSAFAYCTSLTNITISDNVTNIGYRAFYGTELYNDESNWTDDVLYIDNYLIEARTNIEHCDIKQGCLLIAERAFYRCSNLTGITIPDSVTSIGDNTFTDCGHLNIIVDDKNTVYSSKDGVLFNKDMTELIVYAKDSIQQEYDIPESVTSIGDYAFEQCYGLTNISIPEGVTSIGDYAFSDCCRLNIIVADGNAVYSSKDGVLFNKDGTELIVYAKDVIQPKYYIPKGVTSICDGAFYGCDNLIGISIPDSVTSIGDEAFNGCLNLTSISIPDGVTAIGDSVFYYCNRLTSISIPDSVTTIGNAAFYECDSLTDVYYSGTKEQWYAIDIDWENDVLADATIHYNSTPVIADYETAILHYAAGENGSTVVNSIAVNNSTEAIQCTVYTAVYDSAGALKGAGMADVDIAAESDTGVDITVPCSIETGDTIKNFMWNDMTPLCTADEVAAA